jgi:hypothetical protein
VTTGRPLGFQYPIKAAIADAMKGWPRRAALEDRDRALEDYLAGIATVVAPVTALSPTTGSVELDGATTSWATHAITGNVTYTTANLRAGQRVEVFVTCDGTPRTFTFPGWVFVGAAAPAGIAASKTGVLELWVLGDADADVRARWTVEP